MVKTDAFGWEVERRYSDFGWLREILVKEYPLCIIPQMAPKGENNDEISMDNRRSLLQQFLDHICSHSELRSSIVLKAFLSTTDDKSWKDSKTSLEKSQMTHTNFRAKLQKKQKSLFDGKQGFKVKDFRS